MNTFPIMDESVSSADSQIQWGVQVELGKIQVVKDASGKFTTFTFHFRIGQTVHDFTSRYSRLYKFQESLLKSERYQKAFMGDPPPFPSKSYFTDYTKPKNYRKQANKLLEWFQQILSKPTVLMDSKFQKGIHLRKSLQDKMTEIAIDLANRNKVLNMYGGRYERKPVISPDTVQIKENHAEIQKRPNIPLPDHD